MRGADAHVSGLHFVILVGRASGAECRVIKLRQINSRGRVNSAEKRFSASPESYAQARMHMHVARISAARRRLSDVFLPKS